MITQQQINDAREKGRERIRLDAIELHAFNIDALDRLIAFERADQAWGSVYHKGHICDDAPMPCLIRAELQRCIAAITEAK